MKKLENTLGIFSHKASRPINFKGIYGINQLSAFGRDGSYSSWDFVGTSREVDEFEKRWCSKGTNGFAFLGFEILRGFKGQVSYIGRL